MSAVASRTEPGTTLQRELRAASGGVVRERLLRVLCAAPHAPVALLVAPAGSGKTTLLAQWAARDSRPFAVVAVREADNDPDRLLESVVRALSVVVPIDDDVFIALAAPGGAVTADVLDRLARSLAGAPPFVLALDDAEGLTRPAALAALAGFADRLPAGSQLAVAARREPGLPLGRLRAQRRLVELRARELAMTRRELAALLRDSGIDPAAVDLVSLARRTEGWAAGIALAVLGALGEADPARALERFSGANRLVADYWRDEVLAGLHRYELRFLLRTSILDELSGPICDALLERSGSGALLRDLARANVPLVCLDQADAEYRHHALFAEMLRAELRRVEPDRERELRRRAAAWYAEHGDLDRAVEHAVAGADAQVAGRLLRSVAAEHALHGRGDALQSWLDRFTRQEQAAVPGLALSAAAAALARGERDRAEHWAAAAERGALDAGTAIIRAAVCRDGLARMAADAARAAAIAAEDDPWRSLACALQGVAAHLTGDPRGARAQLREGARRGGIAAPVVQVLCLAQLALLAIDEDDWDEAEALGARARAQVDRLALEDCPLAALALAVSARVRAQRGRADAAQADRRAALRALAGLEDFAPWYTAELRVVLAGTALRLGDVAAAGTLAGEARRLARELPDAVVLAAWADDAAAAAATLAERVPLPSSLTTAELRVLQLLPTHLSFREMARGLHVSANTVKTHAHAVYRKLDACSRSEAVVRAREAGLL